VSFQNIIDGSNHKVVTYDITSMPDRGPRAADRGQDRLGRLFDDGEYIAAGGLSGVETDPIPNAGSGPTREHDARGVPNSGFRPMQSGEGDRGHIVDDHGVMPVDLSFGSDEGGSYTRTELGQAGDVAVRVGPNFVLAAKDPFAPASNFKAPTSDASTLKSERVRKSLRRGTFANIVRGPEGGPTDGDNQSTL